MLTHGSLFSGFDAPSLAASYVGWKNLFHCEINEFCNSILKYWFPESEHYGDITKTDFRKWRGKVDVLTGGFPCQPFSIAGKRQGTADNRYLWKEMLRAIQEIRPTWVVGENVAGILTMVQPGKEVEMASQASLFGEDYRKRVLFHEQFIVETICQDLECEGYSVQPIVVPACAVGAPHRRDRVWFIAHCSDTRSESLQRERESRVCKSEIAPNSYGNRCYSRKHNREERSIFYDWERYTKENQSERDERKCRTGTDISFSEYTYSLGLERWVQPKSGEIPIYKFAKRDSCQIRDWQNFPTQPPICRGNDGIPFNVDRLTIPFNTWRTESVRGFGNAIVPAVIFEIYKIIDELSG